MVVSVFGGVGDRTREGNDLWHANAGIESHRSPRTSPIESFAGLVADERAAGSRLCVALTGLAVAEYFRDEENQ